MRFYGFNVEEIAPAGASGMLDLDVDPKMAWALRHREQFPVDLNRAPQEMLLRVPGLGVRTVQRLVTMRAHRKLRYDDLVKLRVAIRKVAPFVITIDYQRVRKARARRCVVWTTCRARLTCSATDAQGHFAGRQ